MCGIVLARTHMMANLLLEGLAHRGRDDRRILKMEGWFVGQNRLAIVDRGPKGAQPLGTRRAVTVFNGELFNYKEIRAGLTSCPEDASEILTLECLMHEYKRFDRMLDGYWGIIRVQAGSGKVTISRDLLGVIPLYYMMSEGRLLAVASEKKAVQCFYKWKTVQAGETLEFNRDGKLLKKWKFDPFSLHMEPIDYEHLKNLFLRAVERRFVHSEVPVSVALSGGLDSALVLAALRKLDKLKQVEAITIGMEEMSDEVSNARQLCWEWNVKHKVILLSPRDIDQAREHMKYTLEDSSDNPIKWRGFVRNYFVAKYAPGTVILCGEGADETACGYPSHARAGKGLGLEWKVLSTLRSMPSINLDRTNKGGMAWTKEYRMPFLDRAYVLYLTGCAKLPEKKILQWLGMMLEVPQYILDKPKYGVEEKRLEATR